MAADPRTADDDEADEATVDWFFSLSTHSL